MDDRERLQAENASLRAEIESYRQRELEALRAQLSAAREEIESLATQANINAKAARHIENTLGGQLADLRAQLNAQQQLESRRSKLTSGT